VLFSVLFDRVVRRQRIQLRAMWWELVRRLFTDTSSTDTCSQPISYTSSPGASSSSPSTSSSSSSSVLLRGVYRQLWYDRVVCWEREQLRRLWWKLVRISPSTNTGSHESGASAASSQPGSDAVGALPSPGVLSLQELVLGFLLWQRRTQVQPVLWQSSVH